MPFFSIIIPSFNRAQHICKAIDSVLQQLCQDFEIIVVDDGSTDDSAQQIMGIKDDRVRYMHQHNQGVAAARNNGAQLANGEYLLFLDSDDTLTSDALTAHHKVLMQAKADMSFADVYRSNEGNQKPILISARNPYNGESSKGLFLAGAFCIKRELFQKIGGYDGQLKFGENAELQLRLLSENPVVAYTDKVGLNYAYSFSGGANQCQNIITSNEYIMNKHADFFRNKPHVVKHYRQKIAMAHICLHQYAAARRNMWLAFRAYPKDIKPLFKMIMLFFPAIAVKMIK